MARVPPSLYYQDLTQVWTNVSLNYICLAENYIEMLLLSIVVLED